MLGRASKNGHSACMRIRTRFPCSISCLGLHGTCDHERRGELLDSSDAAREGVDQRLVLDEETDAGRELLSVQRQRQESSSIGDEP